MGRRSKTSPAEMAAALVGRLGYELESMRLVGEDGWNHSVYYILLGKKPDSIWQDAQFATWVMVDWTDHPEKADRERGAELHNGHYQIDNRRALCEFDRRYRSKLEASYWIHPDTKLPMPGCRRDA